MPDEVITTTEEEVKPPAAEETSEPAKQETKEVDDGIDVAAAKNLYKALSDPKTARPIIEALARQTGLITEDSTKAEKKEAKKTIQAVFKDALGEKFSFMADELGVAIDAVFNHFAAEQDAKINELASNEVKRETERAVEDAYKSLSDFKKYEDRVFELMDELPKGSNMKTSTYLEKLYRVAKSEAEEAATKGKLTKKLKDNSEDATTRLSSSASDREAPTKPAPKASLSIEQAMELAAQQLEEK